MVVCHSDGLAQADVPWPAVDCISDCPSSLRSRFDVLLNCELERELGGGCGGGGDGEDKGGDVVSLPPPGSAVGPPRMLTVRARTGSIERLVDAEGDGDGGRDAAEVPGTRR